MKTAVVFGRGFGLYGHATALSRLGWRVMLPSSYQDAVRSRVELTELSKNIGYFEDLTEAAAIGQLFCLARRPSDNCETLRELITIGFSGSLVIEKPLAPDAAGSLKLLNFLSDAGLRFSTPYLFLYSDWYGPLAEALSRRRHCRLSWVHRQAPNLNGWKHDPGTGGGVLAFYLIHAFALFTGIGSPVERVQQNGDQWLLHGDGLELQFKLGNEPYFQVEAHREQLFQAASPFGAVPKAGAIDPRVEPLMRFYAAIEATSGATNSFRFHHEINSTWLNVVKDTL